MRIEMTEVYLVQDTWNDKPVTIAVASSEAVAKAIIGTERWEDRFYIEEFILDESHKERDQRLDEELEMERLTKLKEKHDAGWCKGLIRDTD